MLHSASTQTPDHIMAGLLLFVSKDDNQRELTKLAASITHTHRPTHTLKRKSNKAELIGGCEGE